MQADLDWGAPDINGQAPRSVFFDDIYFSGDGPAETAHVFLAGNGLPTRFEHATRFSIGELGFGTGLNFLCAWDAWEKAAKPPGAKLSFFSVEAFPIAPDDLVRAHLNWPALARLSAALRAVMAPPHRGFHRIEIACDVTLTLFIGDAADALSALEGAIDAWFLDGFSPAKNPAMWAPDLMRKIACASNDGASVATFTVAGDVRRSLSGAGFTVEKRPGFGRKREMLTGALMQKPARLSRRKPWFTAANPQRFNPGASVGVIGAGIAGASLAHALTRVGFCPTVYETNAPASGASGNPAGIIMARLDAADTPDGRFHESAYLHVLRLLNSLNDNADGNIYRPCGVTQLAVNDEDAAKRDKRLARKALPDGWMEQRGDGVHFPQGGVVDPTAFVRALLGATRVVQAQIVKLSTINNQWALKTGTGETLCHDAVIIANGLDALCFSQVRSLPLSGAAGQIDWFPEARAPDHALVFGPYAAPAPQGGLVIGATYERTQHRKPPPASALASQSNIAAVAPYIGDIAATLDIGAARPRASMRAVTPDGMPVAGPVPDWGFFSGAYDGVRHGRREAFAPGQYLPGLYILSGLGSRGLVTAPLAAAMIAAEMTGEPAPLAPETAETLHPARFFIRALKHAKPVTPR